MRFRLAAIVIVGLLQAFAATDLAEAQRQKGKLGGGAGFAFLSDPDFDLGSTFLLGGFFGYRFNDNVSVEGGLYYNGSNRVYAETGIPVDQTPDLPSFRYRSNRFHADGVLMLNIGRRQPFHPFVLFGGGVRREDNKQTEFEITTDEETGAQAAVEGDVILNETNYVPNVVVGGGAEIYFMYNLAARAEFRMWIPKEWETKTYGLFFAASYFF